MLFEIPEKNVILRMTEYRGELIIDYFSRDERVTQASFNCFVEAKEYFKQKVNQLV